MKRIALYKVVMAMSVLWATIGPVAFAGELDALVPTTHPEGLSPGNPRVPRSHWEYELGGGAAIPLGLAYFIINPLSKKAHPNTIPIRIRG